MRDRTLLDHLVERFDVIQDRPVRTLSKGNRQKIGVVLGLMHRPELLILDEPTSGLDPLMQDEFAPLMRETVAEGRAGWPVTLPSDARLPAVRGTLSLLRPGDGASTLAGRAGRVERRHGACGHRMPSQRPPE
jgi:ABC-type uncharacterized transport system ATPase subunit